MSLKELEQQVKACTKCPLREGATAPVMGIGNVGAKYFLLGEAPGSNEDKAGVPFIGSAGKRLDKLLKLAGISLNDCYLTNVCKCRPPANRDPRKAEIKACNQWLMEEIGLVKPQQIMTLGAVPLSLFSPYGVKMMHGTLFEWESPDGDSKFPVLAMYHPALALHQPRMWAVLLDDFENLPEKVDANYIITPSFTGAHPQHPWVALDTENDPGGGLGQWSIAYRDEEKKLCVTPFYGSKPEIHPAPNIIMHNAKWDLRVLKKAGMKEPENVVDTMIAAYCLGLAKQDVKDSGKSGDRMIGGLGLKYLARRHLGMEMKTWEQVKNKPEDIPQYNADDSVATYLLWEKWEPQLPEHFWTIDMPLLKVLMAMEDRGIAVDPDFLKKYAEALDERLKEFKLPLNPFATAEVQSYVYGTLGIEPWRFTKEGNPSVDAEVLETIDDPVIKDILDYKSVYKEKGTYADSYIKGATNNRIHCEFKQVRTATGRLASANPNLQNVPDPKKGSDMKSLFIAPEGKSLVRLDWEKMELWILAVIAQEERLLSTLLAGRDPHQETADFLGIERHEGRNVNYLVSYGGGAWKLAVEFGVPIDRAKEMIAKYFQMYPGIKGYHQQQIERANNEKKITNYFGRTRRIDAMYAEDWRIRREGEREAINMPIQGAGAEIVKLAMIDLHYNFSAPMLLQVHDELLFEVDEKDAQEYAQWLKEYVPTITEIAGVQLPVDVKIGKTWKEASGQ